MVAHSDLSTVCAKKKKVSLSAVLAYQANVNIPPQEGFNLTLILFQNGVYREVRGHNPAFQWEIHQDSTRSAWCVEC